MKITYALYKSEFDPEPIAQEMTTRAYVQAYVNQTYEFENGTIGKFSSVLIDGGDVRISYILIERKLI
jgi:hypothetical protein